MMAVVRKTVFLGFLCAGVQSLHISHIHNLKVIRNSK